MASLHDKKVDNEGSDSDDSDYQPPTEEKPPPKAVVSRKRAVSSRPVLNDGDDLSDDDGVAADAADGKKGDVKDASEGAVKRSRVELPSAEDGQDDSADKPKETNDIDRMWAEMNAGVRANDTHGKEKRDVTDDLAGWLGGAPSAAAAAAPLALPKLADLEAEAQRTRRQEQDSKAKVEAVGRRATGLEDVLNLVRGAAQSNVLQGSRQSWQRFKKDDTVRDELDAHKKDKDRYTDRVAFLERTDVREWKFEQNGRNSKS